MSIVTVEVSGQIGSFSDHHSNLPEGTYPIANLLEAGSFSGTFSYDTTADRTANVGFNFPFVSADIDIFNGADELIYTIDSAHAGFRVQDGWILFCLSKLDSEAGPEVPNDLRLFFGGDFALADAHPPDGATLAAATFLQSIPSLDTGLPNWFYSILEVNGARDFTFWDAEISDASLNVL